LRHHVEARETRGPFVGMPERGEHGKRGRLAGAVGSEQRDQLALGQLEAELAQRPALAVAHAQALCAHEALHLMSLASRSEHGSLGPGREESGCKRSFIWRVASAPGCCLHWYLRPLALASAS